MDDELLHQFDERTDDRLLLNEFSNVQAAHPPSKTAHTSQDDDEEDTDAVMVENLKLQEQLSVSQKETEVLRAWAKAYLLMNKRLLSMLEMTGMETGSPASALAIIQGQT